jgi:hypothetical protein
MHSGRAWKTVEKLSARGSVFKVLEPVPMSWIPPTYLDCVVYLFDTREDAESGEMQGGSGFVVGYPSAVNPQVYYHYAVTNRHVARGGSPVIRVNTKDGRHDIIELTEEQWIFQDGQDLAVAKVDFPEPIKLVFIVLDQFIDKDLVVENKIGPGDEVFTVGRFATHAGEKCNLPCARFGNISMMDHEPLFCEKYGHDQDSFLVEFRTLGGFSGSPVFVYRTPATMFYSPIGLLPSPHATKRPIGYLPWLLGIVWAYLPSHFELKDKGGDDLKDNLEGAYALGNSGMAAVIPVWRLVSLLNTSPFPEEREEKDNVLKKKQKMGPVLTSAKKKPLSKGEFEEALRKASRKLKPKPSSESGQENA